jgi:hypothetical protein
MISVLNLPIFSIFHKGADLSRKATLEEEPQAKLQKNLSFDRRVLRYEQTNKYDGDFHYDCY